MVVQSYLTTWHQNSLWIIGRRHGHLGENLFHDPCWLHACELLVEALKGKTQSCMVEPKLMKNRGVKIADVNRVLCDVV